MKIIIALVGYYSPHHIKYNEFADMIKYYHKQFSKYNLDYEIKVFTWSLDDSTKQKLEKIVELYTYKKNDDKYILNNISDLKKHNKESPRAKHNLKKIINSNINNIEKNLVLGGSFINVYNMIDLRKKCINELKIYPDSYIFLLRIDAKIEFNNITNWINKNYNVTKCHLARGKPRPWEKMPITDHNGITSYKNQKIIYDISESEISNIFKKVYSAEEFVYYQLINNNIKIIKHDVNLKESTLISYHNHPRV